MASRSCYQISAAVLMVCFLIAAPAHAQHVLYVDAEAPGPTHDGSSWCEAFLELSNALAVAVAGDTIRVANGTYTPDTTGLEDPREATFQLISGVTIEGGYPGCGAPNPNERNIALYETILSGDLNGDDPPNYGHVPVDCCWANDTPSCEDTECAVLVCATRPECCESRWTYPCAVAAAYLCCDACSGPRLCDNAYHVTTGSYTDRSAMLDGLTITAGNAVGKDHPQWSGGAMLNLYGSPSIVDCTVTDNHAAGAGGGIYCFSGGPSAARVVFRRNSSATMNGGGVSTSAGAATFDECEFYDNRALHRGGALYILSGGRIEITGCTFHGNSAFGGGAISHDYAEELLIEHCVFKSNVAWDGGAVMNNMCDPLIANCVFSDNTAGYRGGAIFNVNRTGATLASCTLAGNTAELGGGIYVSAAGYYASLSLMDSIFWHNTDSDGLGESAELWIGPNVTVHLDYSCIYGLTGSLGGTGNIDADPFFVPGPSGCYCLSQADAGNVQQSPCVDAGSDTAANYGLDAMTTRSDEATDAGIVDMGYHYPVTGTTLVMGDYDRSGRLDLRDFAALQRCFTGDGPTDVTPCCRIFDFTPDADVDLSDFAEFRSVMNGP